MPKLTTKFRITIDKLLALIMAILLVAGGMIFSSAAFGLLARGETGMSSVVFSHVVLGIGVGIVLLLICMQVDYHRWRSVAPYVFGVAVFATALVFIPHLGAAHGG